MPEKPQPQRDVLPVPDVTPVGLTTYDAKDPETREGSLSELEPGHVIENAPWSQRIGLKAPRIDPRGHVEPARIRARLA